MVSTCANIVRGFAALVVASAGGCGRLGFATQAFGIDGPSGPVVDSAPFDGPPRCDRTAQFATPVALDNLATSQAVEATMRLLPDELTGYLWTTRSGNIDLAKVTRPGLDAPFTFQSFDELNTINAEFEPTVASDDALLVFRSSRINDEGGGDLYVADKTPASGTFVLRGPLTDLSTANTEVQPFLTDTELLFVSDRSGAERIYRSQRVGGNFATPTEIAELAVAGASDTDPVMTADGKTIYFGSTRPGAIGIDIWTATRNDVMAPFTAATLVANVNSSMTDAPSWISADQCRLYLSSDRLGTPDVYVATRP